MPLYFAYGANMDVAAMSRRCPGSKPLGVARLPRHRFIITSDGYASVVRDPRANVHGVLWEASLADIRTLDKFEEIDRGLYIKISQPVIAGAGPRRALVYVGSRSATGKPRPGYLESVLTSAKAWVLPEDYRAAMAKLLGKPWVEGDAGEEWLATVEAAETSKVQTRAEKPVSTVAVATRASDAWKRS
ncbi:MAG: gamma-glutamylcyclotransferase family protein [Bosea sp. (in: a-proteobacteria)]